jgi:prevent-host-death family protein
MSRKPSATITAGQVKAKFLAVLDDVQQTRTEYVITKRGKPVARLLPAESEKRGDDVFGRLKGTGVIIRGDIFSTGERWEADE